MSNPGPILCINFSGVKRRLVGVRDKILLQLDSLFDPQGRKLCIQCYSVLPSGSNDDFCSQQCMLNYWDEFRRQYDGCSGQTPVCNLPGCVEPCYFENDGRIHDYCKRSHAEQHRKMKEMAQRQLRSRGKKNSGNQWGNGQRAGRGGGQHHGARNPQGAHVGAGYGGTTWSTTGPIYFYNRNEPYYEFTNFYRGHETIILDGCEWPTSEHYFQAQKFVGTPYVERIRNASGPREAFDLSRDPQVSRWIRSDWEEVKLDIMRKALFAKFTQSSHLKRRLLGTGDRELVERSPYDSFWGDGGNGTGQNWLGKLLMELRKKLRSKQTEEDVYRDGASTGHSGSTPYVSQASGPPASDSGSKVRGSSPSSNDLQRPPLHRSKSQDNSGKAGSSSPDNSSHRPPMNKSKSSEVDVVAEESMDTTPPGEVATEILVDIDDDKSEEQSQQSLLESQKNLSLLTPTSLPVSTTDSGGYRCLTDSCKQEATKLWARTYGYTVKLKHLNALVCV